MGDKLGALRFWSLPDGGWRSRITPASGQVRHLSVAKHTNGSRLLLQVTKQGRARLWSIPRGDSESVAALAFPGTWASGALTPDGTGVVLTHLQWQRIPLAYFDPDRTRKGVTFDPPQAAPGEGSATNWAFEAVAVSPDGRLVAAASPHGPLACIWSLDTGHLLKTFGKDAHEFGVTALSFSADSRLLLTASKDNTAKVWSLDDLEKTPTTPLLKSTDPDEITTAQWFPSKLDPPLRAFVTGGGGRDRGSVVWRVFPKEAPRLIKDLRGQISAPARTPQEDGDGTWRLFKDLGGRVSALAFSSDGYWLAAASDTDPRPWLWDLHNRRLPKQIEGPSPHTERVNAIVTWPDDPLLVTASDDATIRFWYLDKDKVPELRGTLSTLAHPSEWVVFTPDGVFDGSPRGQDHLTWRMGGFFDVYRAERFHKLFHQKGLLRQIAMGKTIPPLNGATIGNLPRKPSPLIEFVSARRGAGKPERLVTVDTPSTTIQIEATDRGGGIGKLHVALGAHPIRPPDAESTRAGAKRFTIPLSLVEGENEIMASVFNDDDSVESEPEKLVIKYTRPPLIAIKPRLHLLAVGLSAYDDPALNNSVKYARDDAEAMASLFKRRSLESFERPLDVVTLTNQDATREQILEKLRVMARSTRSADTLVLFFAGHAGNLPGGYHFFPYKMNTSQPPEEQSKSAVSIKDLEQYLYYQECQAANRILILDTCAAGAALEELQKNQIRKEFDSFMRDLHLLMITASPATGKAHESDARKHGVLSDVLLSRLGEADTLPLKDPHPLTAVDGVIDAVTWIEGAWAYQRQRMTNSRSTGAGSELDQEEQWFDRYIDPYYNTKPVPLFSAPVVAPDAVPKPVPATGGG